jgi:hypothetical protein
MRNESRAHTTVNTGLDNGQHMGWKLGARGRMGRCGASGHVGQRCACGDRTGAPPGSVGDRLSGPIGPSPKVMYNVYIYILGAAIHHLVWWTRDPNSPPKPTEPTEPGAPTRALVLHARAHAARSCTAPRPARLSPARRIDGAASHPDHTKMTELSKKQLNNFGKSLTTIAAKNG